MAASRAVGDLVCSLLLSRTLNPSGFVNPRRQLTAGHAPQEEASACAPLQDFASQNGTYEVFICLTSNSRAKYAAQGPLPRLRVL